MLGLFLPWGRSCPSAFVCGCCRAGRMRNTVYPVLAPLEHPWARCGWETCARVTRPSVDDSDDAETTDVYKQDACHRGASSRCILNGPDITWNDTPSRFVPGTAMVRKL